MGCWSLSGSSRFSTTLAHSRLAIVSPESGSQPIVDSESKTVLCVNGEIYNHAALRRKYEWRSITLSDCEVIMHFHAAGVPPQEYLNELRGMFSFVVYDYSSPDNTKFVIARDPYGIIPLYYGSDEYGGTWAVSELKAMPSTARNVRSFPPGHFMTESMSEPRPYAAYGYASLCKEVTPQFSAPSELFQRLEDAVVSHLMCDVPFGVLLSGGLDSSIIAALACKNAAKRVESDGIDDAWYPRIHTFSIGLEGSPDLEHARSVANHLGTVHHEFKFTVEEAISQLSRVIEHIETYDTTTIRASTPMMLMAQKIRALGIKMVLSGEGADEVFAGYLYFAKAPCPEMLHEECVRKVKALHMFDCLRANKSMMAYGVECRVPFLDTPFVEYAMRLDPALKMCRDRPEKQLLREAFGHLLPRGVAERQKEQFSDGVGYSWIDGVQEHARAQLGGRTIEQEALSFSINPPETAEQVLFRKLFARIFKEEWHAATVPWGPSIACSTPAAIAWDAEFASRADPSGRAIHHHAHSLQQDKV